MRYAKESKQIIVVYFMNKKSLTPLFFIAIGLIISCLFLFIPSVYDPLITKFLPAVSLTKEKQLINYLLSVQEKENILIGIRNVNVEAFCNSRKFQAVCADNGSFPAFNAENVKRQIAIFQESGLKNSWILAEGPKQSNNEFKNTVKSLGYDSDYFFNNNGDPDRSFVAFFKPDGAQALDDFVNNKTANLTALKKISKQNVVYAEYSGNETAADAVGPSDTNNSIQGIILNIQDYGKTKNYIVHELDSNKQIKFVLAEGIAADSSLASVKDLVKMAESQDRFLLLAASPVHLEGEGNGFLSSVIKTTWLVFVFFFLVPAAIMAPYHWHERRKIRKNTRKLTNLPKVSLIFPAYNEEKFIHKTIEQGLMQDYPGELEIIIIDDGSTDRTSAIVNEWEERYPQLKVYNHIKNMGKPAALNTGFAKASGEISIFSDSDGHLDSDLVSKLVPHFEDPEVGMVAGMVVIDNEVNLLTKLQQLEYLYNQEIVRFCQSAHKGVLICPGAATAVRTHIARQIPSTERTITEDADFTFEVAKAGWKVTQEPEAISRTDGMENWQDFINQRKRWLYGVLQTICLHPWALFFRETKIPNLWVWWAWIGYFTCPITVLAVLAIPIFYHLIGISYLIFLGFYSLVIGIVFVFIHWYGLIQYTREPKVWLSLLLPLYMVYQYLLNILLFYMVIVWAVRKGITVRYGGRDIHAL